MKTLRALFLEELAEMYDGERRMIKGLPRIMKAATSEELERAIQSHSRETEGHAARIEEIFGLFGEKPSRQTSEGIMGLLDEGEKLAAEFKGSPAINAALISTAQKVEHYEIATYGCLHEWAGRLGSREAAAILQEILDDEKAADASLSELARASSNEEAAEAAEVKHVEVVLSPRFETIRQIAMMSDRVFHSACSLIR